MPELVDRLNTALDGRYAITEELGEGGMAVVYIAEDLRHHRKVALKVLRPELAAVVGAERFLVEIETTAHLQHPHILPLFDSGEADGFLFYVMPYVEGESLRERLDREHQLPVDEAVRIARDLAEALDYAHRQGVIHRDIKPANILMHEGRPLIADFGIALAVGAAGRSRLTETGLSLGTPYYMSPEQATGDVVLGPPSDVYALGCVLYEMLVGEPPHTGSTAQAVLARIIQGGPVFTSAQRPSVPANVDAAIRRAVEMLPADRFTSGKDFAAALADPAFRHGEDGTAAAGRRWKRVAVGTAAAAALFLAAFAWALLRGGPAPVVSRYGIAFAPGQAPLDQVTQTLALAPDGSFIAYVGPGPEGRDNATGRLWVKRRDRFEAMPLAGTEGAAVPSVSRDGKWIAYQAGSRLRKIPATGGASVALADSLGPGGESPVAWLDDGSLVYVDRKWRLRRLPAGGGVADSIWAPPKDRIDIPDGSLPGSRGILFTVCDLNCSGVQEIWVLDLRTGLAHPLVNGALTAAYAQGYLASVRPDGTVLAAPFDLRSLEIRGNAVPVLDGVKVDQGVAPDFTLASDGTMLMRIGAPVTPKTELVWVTRGGVATPVDSGWTFDAGDAHQGWALSPDGTRLALRIATQAGLDIWVKQLPHGPLSRLTFDPKEDRKPQWSPDGTRVTFVSDRLGNFDVWTKRADGTGDARLLYDGKQSLADAFWTPDGKWLVLRTGGVRNRRGGRDILLMRRGDSVPRPLIATRYDESAPAVSPDSRWIAYQSHEADRDEIFVRPFPHVDRGKWQVSTDGGVAPRWAHNGHELFYIDARHDLVSVQVDTLHGFHVGARKVLFHLGDEYSIPELSNSMYDVSRDDQRFLFATVAGGGGTQTRIILVEHWTQELKAKLGG